MTVNKRWVFRQSDGGPLYAATNDSRQSDPTFDLLRVAAC
jgi:hypothetical protein